MAIAQKEETLKIRVRLFALYREKAGTDSLEISLPQGETVADLLDQIRSHVPELSLEYRHTLVAVNADYAEPDYPLQEGDEIALIPPVSGGTTMKRITHEPLDVQSISDSVRQETNGAVITFQGTTRLYTRDKRVVSLEYEAYQEMAEKKMEEIAQEVRQRWDLEDIALYHRIGHLEIGETSLVVAIASPHRKEAFEAARYAVDRIKEMVPIWKKEVFEDGEVWVGSETEEHATHAH